MKWSYWIPQLIFLCVFVFYTVGLIPEANGINIGQLQFGFNGHYKRNSWTPLFLRIESADEKFTGTVEVIVENRFTGSVQRYSQPVNLARRAFRRLSFYIFPRGIAPTLTIRAIDTDGREQAHEEFTPSDPKRPQDFLVLGLASNIDVLGDLTGNPLNGLGDADTPAGTIYVTYFDGRMKLPDTWKGYDAIDLIVIRDMPLESHLISSKQQTALLEWIYGGGTLLVSGGRNIQYLEGSFLEPLLPVTEMQLRTTEPPPILTRQLGFAFDKQRRFELIDSTLHANGRGLVMTGKIPVIAERDVGDGKIVSLAFDYSVQPFAVGENSHQLWNWLLHDVVPSLRYASHSGQAQRKRESAFDPFRRQEERMNRLLMSKSNSHSPLLRFMGIFLAVYVVGLATANYIFATRIRRVKVIWFGQFGVIAIFISLPLILNYARASDVEATSFSLVNIYPDYARARLETYLGLRALDNAKCSLRYETSNGTETPLVYGHLFMRPLANLRFSFYEFVQGRTFHYKELQLNPWTARTFHAESGVELEGMIESDLSLSKDIVEGTLTNRLQFDLEDAYITYKNFYDDIGTLAVDSEVAVRMESRHSDDAPIAISEAIHSDTKRRGAFARILSDEGVLKHLAQPARPTLIGWTKTPFVKFDVGGRYTITSETVVIIHLQKG